MFFFLVYLHFFSTWVASKSLSDISQYDHVAFFFYYYYSYSSKKKWKRGKIYVGALTISLLRSSSSPSFPSSFSSTQCITSQSRRRRWRRWRRQRLVVTCLYLVCLTRYIYICIYWREWFEWWRKQQNTNEYMYIYIYIKLDSIFIFFFSFM